jgi:N-acetyl sugar amidotransferase
MEQFKRFLPIDTAPFTLPNDQVQARWGMPQEVRFCKRCVISNQRPHAAETEYALTSSSSKPSINIGEDGVCDACRYWEAKHSQIDWADREKMLREFCDKHRRHDGGYDCLVPGSGGKDSIYAAWLLKYKYGMHPMTVTWAPHLYTEWGWNNFQSWIHAGFDNNLITPNGQVHRLLSRLALESMLHPFQPFVLGQKTIAVKMSILYNIPLVFYGDHASEWGIPLAEAKEPKMNYNWFQSQGEANTYIGGVSIADLKGRFGVGGHDLTPYLPIDPDLIAKAKTEVHYLGFYEKWHHQANYYFAMEHTGFKPSPERTPGTYSKYASIDDKMDDFNFYTYYIKFGIGRATYDAATEIRSKDIVRDEGVALVKRYDGEFPERFAEEVFRYFSMNPKEFPEASKMFEQPIVDKAYFDHLCDRFRSPHIWKWENENWVLRHAVHHQHKA